MKWIRLCKSARVYNVFLKSGAEVVRSGENISSQIAKMYSDLGSGQHQGGSTAPQHTALTADAICWAKAQTAVTVLTQIHQIKYLSTGFSSSSNTVIILPCLCFLSLPTLTHQVFLHRIHVLNWCAAV